EVEEHRPPRAQSMVFVVAVDHIEQAASAHKADPAALAALHNPQKSLPMLDADRRMRPGASTLYVDPAQENDGIPKALVDRIDLGPEGVRLVSQPLAVGREVLGGRKHKEGWNLRQRSLPNHRSLDRTAVRKVKGGPSRGR